MELDQTTRFSRRRWRVVVLASLFSCAALAACVASRATVGAQGDTLAITNVTVIDVSGGPSRTGQTVLVSGDRITAINPAGEAKPSPGTVVVDGGGKFLIPGLWDMHVHWYDKETMPLFVANGVTGVRIMFGDTTHFQWRAAHLDGTPQMPRLVIASPIVDGPKPYWPNSIGVSTPEEARGAVDAMADSKADFVKVYDGIPRDAYFALMDEAKKRDMTVAGHLPSTVTLLEASGAGQHSVEHLSGLIAAASKDEDVLRTERAGLLSSTSFQLGSPLSKTSATRIDALNRRALDTQDDGKIRGLLADLARNRTWQCPTLVVLRMLAAPDDPAFRVDYRRAYVPARTQQLWEAEIGPLVAGNTPERVALAKALFARNMELLGAMYRAGVPIIAGTDVGNAYLYPGFSLHDELQLLVQAGLTPIAALQSATRNAAEYLGRSADFGTVDVGKKADLVLLDANPLDDITNTKRIAAVVIDGKILRRTEIDRTLDDIKAWASRPSVATVLAEVLQKDGPQAVIRRYDELLQSDPEKYDYSVGALTEISFGLMMQRKYPELVRWVEVALTRFPDLASGHEFLGDLYAGGGRLAEARASYQRALELAPGSPNPVYKLRHLAAPVATR